MARLSPRVDIKVAASIIDAKRKKYATMSKNICFRGICFGPTEGLPLSHTAPGSDLDIVVLINSTEKLIITGRVVWRHKQDLGFRFVSISRWNLEKIWKYMSY